LLRSAFFVLSAVFAFARLAHADPEADADLAFRAASQRAAAGEPGALDAYEALGAARPVTRWTDDAWLEAGRFAVRTGAYDRARRDLEQAIAITSDEQLSRRARGELDRIARFTGDAGQWSQVAGAHERLADRVLAKGDPKPALRELEALIAANPSYPRAADAMLVIAQGWERDGASDRAIEWLVRAKSAAGDSTSHQRASGELARALVRDGQLAAARVEIGDPSLRRELAGKLASAEWKRVVRWILWGVLAAIAAATVIALRRSSISWRGALRRLVRPPVEAMFFVPIALVLVVIAQTGNPLVARAVRWIAISGAVVAWLSGVILEGVRARGPIGLRRASVHAVVAAIAVASAAYLAVDRDRMIDLVVETWREGPAAR
jgi:predicted negative regulator of RcsB-dependent stress response